MEKLLLGHCFFSRKGEGDRVLMEDFNSEISGSSCSIPSEPPDIRNWFSSYKYESFVLDTCENFGGIFSEERDGDECELIIGKLNREKEENFDGSGEIRKADEHGNLNSKEVQDSLHTLSILSEPPDIRKWFSSYEYESPLLDTNDGFKSSVSRESECEKDELAIGESIKDELENLGKFQAIKNSCEQDASDKSSIKLIKCSSSLVDREDESHPLFSETPDIGNWFPDYLYESPVLDTNDEFKDTLSEDKESSKDKFAVEDSKREKQENCKTTTNTRCRDEVVAGKMCSNGFGDCNSPLRHGEQENKSISQDLHGAGVKESLPWQGDSCFEKNLDPNLEFKQELSSSINSREGVEDSALNGGDSLSELKGADSQSLDISRGPSNKDRKSSKKLIDRKGSIEKSSETKILTDNVDLAAHNQSLEFGQVHEGYLRKPTHGTNDKEKVAENGYVTTRKNKFKKTNDENFLTGHVEILLECSRKTTGGGGEKDSGVMKRKVLAETTNVNVQQGEAKVMEIAGKWRCPQKSKPPRGPPLKQLRLEQWIHRA